VTATEEIHERAHDDNAPMRSLHQKLLAAIKAVGVVEKDGRNAFHKYSYSSIEAIVAATEDALAEQGLLIIAGQETISDRQRQTNQGESTVTTIELAFQIIDTETGQRLEIPWAGRGEDPADKGVAKAFTDARKTFLIQQLNLRRGEDTEADEGTDQRSSSGYGGTQSQANHVDLNAEAKGMSNAQLNAILVSAGLPASEKPWGSFFRIPRAHEAAVREAIARERAT
jgi:hypothetical protein